MALTDEGMNTTMLVQPSGAMSSGGFGNGWGGDGFWIILLFILLGGWNNNGFGGGFGGNNDLYPWMNQSNQMNNGFRDQMLNSSINGIQQSITSGFGDVQTALCGGFAGVNAAITGAQMADLERSFASQTATMQGMNAIQSQLAQCCCDNRLATCQTQNIVQNEGNTTRFADANNTRDIIQSQTAGTQAILDKLCQLELDGVKAQVEAKNDKILDLQNQLNMASLRESQIAQNAFIQNGFTQEVDALYNRLNNCPVPSTPVYGRTPIFTCNQNQGCGCMG